MSSSAPVVTSVSTLTTAVMESLIAVIAQMSKTVVSIQKHPSSYAVLLNHFSSTIMYKVADMFEFLFILAYANVMFLSVVFAVFQLQGLQVCATMRVSSSASQMATVSHPPGSAMATQTVRMAATNTTPVHLVPARPRCSAAITETVCYVAGSATGTTTAGT